jgi:hypothetical protein
MIKSDTDNTPICALQEVSPRMTERYDHDGARAAGDCRNFQPNSSGTSRGNSLSVDKNGRERDYSSFDFGLYGRVEDVEETLSNMEVVVELLEG